MCNVFVFVRLAPGRLSSIGTVMCIFFVGKLPSYLGHLEKKSETRENVRSIIFRFIPLFIINYFIFSLNKLEVVVETYNFHRIPILEFTKRGQIFEIFLRILSYL